MIGNEVVLFEQNQLDVMRKLSELNAEKKRIDALDAELRDKLVKAMDDYGIVNFKNDYVSITKVDATESVSVDLKALEKAEPHCYKGLIEDYPKVTKKKAYVRITVK